MAVQSAAQRVENCGKYMQSYPPGTTVTYTKPDIQAAYNALDQWFSDNASAINAALPQPYRGAASITDKAHLLEAVVSDRYLQGI